jgi:hypothetical protein
LKAWFASTGDGSEIPRVGGPRCGESHSQQALCGGLGNQGQAGAERAGPGYKEDPDGARERHYAAHPEDLDANIVIYEFFDDVEMADES